MRLRKLILDNFKGIRALTIESVGGADIDVYGDNATGKTTIADAITWLLFGRDSHNAASFDIKTRGEDGEVIPAVDHSVFAEFMLESGSSLTLQRTYKEKWVKQRGRAEAEFGGHTTDFHVNTVPVSEKEFLAKVSSVCEEKRFRILSDPAYFASTLPWKERREMLLGLIGAVTDAEVIASKDDLSVLPALLGEHTMEEFGRIVAQRVKAINEELKMIPARIDEASRSVAELPTPPPEGDQATLTSELRQVQERRADLRAGGADQETLEALKAVQAELSRRRNQVEEETRSARLERAKALDALSAERRTLLQTFEPLSDKIERAPVSLRRQEEEINELRAKAKALIDAPIETTDTTCPSCGQPLQAEKVQAAIETAREARARQIERIREEGKSLVAKLEANRTALEGWLAEQSTQAAAIRDIEARILAAQQEDQMRPAAVEDPETVRLSAESARLLALVQGSREESDQEIASLNAKATALEEQITAIEQYKALVEASKKAQSRVQELRTRQKELAGDLEEAERHRWLCEEFVRTRTALLESKVNSHFATARFRLFEEQVNGGVSECCEVTLGGVPWASINHGAQVNLGLEIIDAFAEAQGFAPLVVIDNAEAITELRPSRGQQIRLIVSAKDKSLRIETNHKEKAS